MKRILTALILIPLVLVLVFLPPLWQWLFSLAVAVVAALAGWEYLALTMRCGANPPRIATVGGLLVLFLAHSLGADSDQFLALLAIVGLALLVFCVFFKPLEEAIANASSSIFCLLYTGLTLFALPALREPPYGSSSMILFLLCVVWAGDTAAYYVGRAFGRHKMAPTFAPARAGKAQWHR